MNLFFYIQVENKYLLDRSVYNTLHDTNVYACHALNDGLITDQYINLYIW